MVLRKIEDKDQDSRDPLTLLGGTALRVYLLLLMHGRSLGVRDVQRILGFKSPSTARHHLERLVELGLVVRDGWGYRALEPRGVLSHFIFIQGKAIPRTGFLAGFLLASSVIYAILPGSDPRALVFLVPAAIIALLDTLRLHRGLRRILKAVETS